ncbi:unnamed protein product, partial [Mesorhabditis spiculigera]
MLLIFLFPLIIPIYANIGRSGDHLEESQLTFLRYVLPDYFSKVTDSQLEDITAYQTDEKLTYTQQKEETFRYLAENNIGGEIKEHFNEYYKLEAGKRDRFRKYTESLAKAIERYFSIYNQRTRPMREIKEEINTLIEELDKPVANGLKVAINELESSRILNHQKKSRNGRESKQQEDDLAVDMK